MNLFRYICAAGMILFTFGSCMPERESFPLPEETPTEPVGDKLYEVLTNPASDYNTIVIDPLNPDLPDDFLQRWTQAVENVDQWVHNGTDGRQLHSMLVHFTADNTVTVAAFYSVRAASNQRAVATWTYNFEPDDQGVGRLEYVSQNGNGATLGPQIMDVLAYFLEEYVFRLDWVNEDISVHPDENVELGGLFRVDNSQSYVFGKLIKVDALTTPNWPLPTTPAIDEFFKVENPIDQMHYSSVLVFPDDPVNSPAFQALWNDVKATKLAEGNRTISHFKWVFDSRFERMRMTVYYRTSGGAKSGTFYRYVPAFDYGNRVWFLFNSEDGNGGILRDPRLIDNLIESHQFVISEATPSPSGERRLKFTSEADPSIHFTGELGFLAANCCGDWSD